MAVYSASLDESATVHCFVLCCPWNGSARQDERIAGGGVTVMRAQLSCFSCRMVGNVGWSLVPLEHPGPQGVQGLGWNRTARDSLWQSRCLVVCQE